MATDKHSGFGLVMPMSEGMKIPKDSIGHWPDKACFSVKELEKVMAEDQKGKEVFVDKKYITKDNITRTQQVWTDTFALFNYLWEFAVKGIIELNVQKDENGDEVMNISFTGVNK
ncbi:hypothetical protein CMI37_22910 [Candidatus Pacearchaeota archaeon]|nr:hypothetical protein [Candidatus Pacearchaeota archaeon]